MWPASHRGKPEFNTPALSLRVHFKNWPVSNVWMKWLWTKTFASHFIFCKTETASECLVFTQEHIKWDFCMNEAGLHTKTRVNQSDWSPAGRSKSTCSSCSTRPHRRADAPRRQRLLLHLWLNILLSELYSQNLLFNRLKCDDVMWREQSKVCGVPTKRGSCSDRHDMM